jgi:hypothetical protein
MEITKITFSELILFATFLALLWYAWETRRMRKEMVDQTELQLTPFLVIIVETHEVMVANYGESTARDIEIKCSSSVKGVLKPCLPTNSLPKGEKKVLEIATSGGFAFLLTDDFEGAKEIHFELKYSNILGKKYQTKGTLKNEGFSVTEFKNK